MFEEGQQIRLTLNYYIEDEYEELTGDVIPAGTEGVIDEVVDFDWYRVSFEKYGLFEMTSQVLEAIPE